MKSLFYEHLFDLEGVVGKDCRFLSIGPEEITTEFCLVTNKGMKQNCKNCSFYFECTKGQEICNGKLCYKPCTFDKVFLHAEAFHFIENKFEEALRILKINGEIITLLNSGESSKYAAGYSCSFETGQLMKQINNHALNIQSISTFKGLKRGSLLRLVLSK